MSVARRPRAGVALLLLVALGGCADGRGARDLEFGDLGTTRLVTGGGAGLVLVLTDHAADAQAHAIAAAVAATGRSAAIVDLDVYLARVTASGADCLDAATLFDVYAQRVQQELRFERFSAAALAGVGRGAAFVPLLLAGSRAGLFAAGVSAGEPPPLNLPIPPCGPLAAEFGWRAPDVALTVPADLHTATPWAASPDAAPANVLGKLDALPVRSDNADAPAALPLVELPQPADNPAPWFVLVISGDGGWANIDRDIAEELGAQGIPVLGWNSLRYFWEAKTPDQAGADLARAVRHYLHAWGKSRVLLVGYSMGADVLPFMTSRAPDDVRAAIAGLVLLNPGQTVDFQFHISNWIGHAPAAPYALEPEMGKLGGTPVLCLYAADEAKDSLCPALKDRADTRVRAFPGDHHFDGDYAGVTRAILERFPATPPT